LEEFIKKIKKAFKKELKAFKKKNNKDKIFTLVFALIILDMSIFTTRVMVDGLSKKESGFETFVKNAKEIDYYDLNTSITPKLIASEKVFFKTNDDKSVEIYFKENNETKKVNNIPALSVAMNIERKLMDNNATYQWVSNKQNIITPIILTFISDHFILILLFGYIAFTLKEMGHFGNNDKFEIYKPSDIRGSMKKIIGYEDIKEEIKHFQDLIKKKNKYKLYGITETSNILFSGAPGTGKTKIATYMAKELNMPIIIATGNLETGYVAGGAKVIKSLFKTAEKTALASKNRSCIIFIDEGQTLLSKRGQHKEKWADDTNNELLAHLDGVRTKKDINIIVIIASNFNENNFEIDEAMARRFKKKIDFRLPNLEERDGMLKFFLKKVTKKEKNIDTNKLAKSMSGLSGAIIETIIQEAGQIAIQNNEKVNEKNIMKAFETILIGKSDRKTTADREKARKIISIHEMGHFMVDFAIKYKENKNDLKKTKNSMNLIKISSESISRANALGFVLSETDDNLLMSVNEYENQVMGLYGGVAAEEVVLGKKNITTGAKNDIEKVTKILNHLINETASYSDNKINHSMLFEDSKENIKTIEKKSIDLYRETRTIIEENKDLIEYLSKILIDRWVLSKDEVFEEIKKYQNKKWIMLQVK